MVVSIETDCFSPLLIFDYAYFIYLCQDDFNALVYVIVILMSALLQFETIIARQHTAIIDADSSA